jgi:hypothetical protein
MQTAMLRTRMHAHGLLPFTLEQSRALADRVAAAQDNCRGKAHTNPNLATMLHYVTPEPDR